MQRPPKLLVDSAAQRNQAATKGATRLDPSDLQGLTGGTGGTLQHVVLLDLSLEHCLHYDGGLGCPGDLLLQPYTKTSYKSAYRLLNEETIDTAVKHINTATASN